MEKINQAIQAFEESYTDYMGIYQAGMEQEQHIVNEDMEPFEQAAGVVQSYMDRIRLRQQRLPGMDLTDFHNHPALEKCRQQLVHIINKIELQRQSNESMLQSALERTRSEMKKLQQSRRAARGYRKQKGQSGRFVDGLRSVTSG